MSLNEQNTQRFRRLFIVKNYQAEGDYFFGGNDAHVPFAISGMIWIPDDPAPITPAFFPLKSYLPSQFAECINLPLNFSKPAIEGHLQELCTRSMTSQSVRKSEFSIILTSVPRKR